MMTALEGNKMARNGRVLQFPCNRRHRIFVAGTIATVGITFSRCQSPSLPSFSPQDYFALMVLAFMSVSVVRARPGCGVSQPFLVLSSYRH